MSHLRENILAAKERLAQGMIDLKRRHDEGVSGVEVSAAITDLRDEVLLNLTRAALASLKAEELLSEVALVAHGGYGRRDVAPFSDVDLMIVHAPDAQGPYAGLAERLLRDVFDTGLVLGQNLCTPQQAAQLALEDPLVCTSLGESRLLVGSQQLFADFMTNLQRQVRRRRKPIVARIEKARREERVRYGETVFLLEPNLKRSRGTLRDIQFLRWLGFVRYDTADPRQLYQMGMLSEDDLLAIELAHEFLLRLRNELHFDSDKPGDVLDRPQQWRIAEMRGYRADGGMLPVERFMRDYFRHTARVSHIVTQFLAKVRSNERVTQIVTALFGHRVQDHLRVGPAGMVATRRGRERLRGNLAAIIQMLELANLYDQLIAPPTWEVVRREVPRLPDALDHEARRGFLSFLSHPARLAPILRDMHQAGLLERFIPAFTHARGLLQFNQYHKYTVDEHCLRAVEAAAEMAHDNGPLGQAYRWIQRKHVLHLALLIHDLGKGFPDDHIQVGERIAAETAARLELPPLDAETLRFLVSNHQMMGHVALRRDINDKQLLVHFAVDVGSPELLAMLYVMTAADFSAVGPDTWDSWKAEILTELYYHAMEYLAGDSSPIRFGEHLQQQRHTTQAWLGAQEHEDWFTLQLQSLPPAYLASTPPQQVADDLRMLHDLKPGDVQAQGQYLPETHAVQFTVATSENIVPGIFHRLTGALSSHGLEILSAQINTLADGLVIDRFWVTDPDFADEPPAERLEQVSRSLADALRSPTTQPPKFRRTWQSGSQTDSELPVAQTRVNIDNSSSTHFTVLDIFALDRVGLLYTITRKLFELGLSVGRAKIATHLDQVVDVFYVTDQKGKKVEDESRLQDIRRQILDAIAQLEQSE
jgi:[protein-PII] uridylyltransferase